MEPTTPLRPVPGPSIPARPAPRSESRPRPGRSLPTDRMKVEVQRSALLALARLSFGTRPVDANALGVALNISPATAPLSNGFFRDSGWIERSGKGKYVATPALMDYYNKVNSQMPNAGASLAATAANAWYWEALSPYLSATGTPLSRTEAIYHLRRAAEATPDHDPQVANLLEWLQIIGLVRLTEDGVVRADGAPAAQPTQPQPTPPTTENEPDTVPAASTATEVPKPTTQTPAKPGTPPIVSFHFDVQLSAIDLAALSPEQIKSLFEAVGTIAAVTNAKP